MPASPGRGFRVIVGAYLKVFEGFCVRQKKLPEWDLIFLSGIVSVFFLLCWSCFSCKLHCLFSRGVASSWCILYTRDLRNVRRICRSPPWHRSRIWRCTELVPSSICIIITSSSIILALPDRIISTRQYLPLPPPPPPPPPHLLLRRPRAEQPSTTQCTTATRGSRSWCPPSPRTRRSPGWRSCSTLSTTSRTCSRRWSLTTSTSGGRRWAVRAGLLSRR